MTRPEIIERLATMPHAAVLQMVGAIPAERRLLRRLVIGRALGETWEHLADKTGADVVTLARWHELGISMIAAAEREFVA